MGHFGVRSGLEMILSHRAPSNLNMSSYGAIWTHFRPNSIFFDISSTSGYMGEKSVQGLVPDFLAHTPLREASKERGS